MRIITKILTTRRPHDGEMEKRFAKKVLDKIPGMQTDGFGNRYLRIGKSKTLFSCHIDTVHRTDGKQKIIVDKTTGIIYADNPLPKKQTASKMNPKGKLNKWSNWRNNTVSRSHECLGADDGAGIYMLIRLIAAKVPGLYIFHRGEECGGLGSNWIVQNTPELLEGIQRAIAFDRKGQQDIISYQSGGGCCSNKFVTELSAAFNMGHKAANGTFTDTANYTELIPECTNVSVGYENEHTGDELLYYPYLFKLAAKAIHIDWEKLGTYRDPEVIASWNGTSSYNSKSRSSLMFLSKAEISRLVYAYPDEAIELLMDFNTQEYDLIGIITRGKLTATREQLNWEKDKLTTPQLGVDEQIDM